MRDLEIMSCSSVKTASYYECDGCHHKMTVGERFVTGIESCCGSGCVRNLCAECIEWAAQKLKDLSEKDQDCDKQVHDKE